MFHTVKYLRPHDVLGTIQGVDDIKMSSHGDHSSLSFKEDVGTKNILVHRKVSTCAVLPRVMHDLLNPYQ